MGGCASRPNETHPEVLPAENPTVPDQSLKAVEGDLPSKEKVDLAEVANVEKENEEPLVDLLESKMETPSLESVATKTAVEEIVSEIGGSAAEVPQGSAIESVVAQQVTKSVPIEAANEKETEEKIANEKETQKVKDKAVDSVVEPVKTPEIVKTATNEVQKAVKAVDSVVEPVKTPEIVKTATNEVQKAVKAVDSVVEPVKTPEIVKTATNEVQKAVKAVDSVVEPVKTPEIVKTATNEVQKAVKAVDSVVEPVKTPEIVKTATNEVQKAVKAVDSVVEPVKTPEIAKTATNEVQKAVIKKPDGGVDRELSLSALEKKDVANSLIAA